MKWISVFASALLATSFTTVQTVRVDDDAAIIKNAESAAPATIAKDVCVYGKLSHLREGTNGCCCMPDDPSDPKPDPMCGDAKSMDRVKGRVNRTEPPKGKVDFIYILQG